MGEDLRRELDTHADVHAVGLCRDIKAAADALHPLAAAAAYGDHAVLTGEALLPAGDPVAALDALHGSDSGIEMEFDLAAKLVVEVFQHDIVDIRAQVAHLRVEQMQAVFQAHALDAGVGGGIELRALPAVGEVDLIHVTHQLDGLVLADVLIECAAELVRNVVFSVRKGARAPEAAHDAAHGALDAALDLLAVDGTFALGELASKLEDRYLLLRRALGELVGGEDAAGAGADDDDVEIHGDHPFKK